MTEGATTCHIMMKLLQYLLGKTEHLLETGMLLSIRVKVICRIFPQWMQTWSQWCILFFPRGEPGWHNRIPHVAVRATGTRNTTTILQYYTYRLAALEYFSPIHYGKKLFQQYCVDSYVKVEGNNLNYIRANQTILRVDSSECLADHLNSPVEKQGFQPGRIVVLPSSFQGSPCGMAQSYQDAMTVIDPNDKLRDADDIHSVISAKIPNQQEHTELFEMVRSCMIHRPCGHLNPNSRCMEDGVCTKSFPKNLLASMVAEVNGYPLYRRRDNGIHINVNNVDIDNRWIVPYNIHGFPRNTMRI
ncbi:uncharacterized protein LOC130624237 [Hydractinia symbiolongicarpus]|uniref:uncharacterized protein LOC130624237 n=1 Tax=Hydractinia symbiolongicarpus TaxID=13093 RepID=UPI00254AEB6A|nr:uncharacterized protein LOC130624237 [Hydractinia symbiolongicarpus]